MKRHVKASSVGSTSGRASRLGSIRRALTTRARPSGDSGFGAPSQRSTPFATGLLAAAFALLAVAPSAMAAPPVITDVGAVNIADTSVRMVGTIDPANSETGYIFQYGTTPVLGSSTTALAIGGGTTPITVSQVVGGLAPNTTYYFRLFATNLAGDTTSASQAFTTRTDPLPLPEGRAYEMVSPPDKNQGGVDQYLEHPNADFSRDGNAAAFCTTALFGEPPGQMGFDCAPYISRRTPTGWQTTNPFPPYCPSDRAGSKSLMRVLLSSNFEYAALTFPETAACPIPPLDPAAPLNLSANFYRQDLTTTPSSYDLLTTKSNSDWLANSNGGVMTGTDDFSNLVIRSNHNQTDPPDSPPEGNFRKVYHWDEGSLSLVSKDPAGNPFTTESTFPTAYYVGGQVPVKSALSTDGSRIFFQNEANNIYCVEAACHLYMREDDATTYDVSASECTLGPATCGSDSSPDRFVWARPDGTVALFTSCDKLTDASAPPAAGCGTTDSEGYKLYRWELAGAPGHRLTDLTVDEEPGDGEEPGAVDIFGASDNGDTVYFFSKGQIVAGKPAAGGIYRWIWNGGSPSVDFLGPYNYGDFGNDSNLSGRHVRVTPDGQYLLIETSAAIRPAFDRDTDFDLYRWGPADGWMCVSCQVPGVPSAGSLDRDVIWTNPYDVLITQEPEASISDDGRHVFFTTPDALVPADVNGEVSCPKPVGGSSFRVYQCDDVYEWTDGTLSLVSSGTGAEPSVLIGATHSARDVFFMTRNRLVGWDSDDGIDIYDARIGGGFPEPPPQPPTCEGESCRGQGTSTPGVTGAGTAVFESPGNPVPKHQTARKHHKKKRHHKRAHSRAAKHNRRAGR